MVNKKIEMKKHAIEAEKHIAKKTGHEKKSNFFAKLRLPAIAGAFVGATLAALPAAPVIITGVGMGLIATGTVAAIAGFIGKDVFETKSETEMARVQGIFHKQNMLQMDIDNEKKSTSKKQNSAKKTTVKKTVSESKNSGPTL